MPTINLAHLRDQGIDFAVFFADATNRNENTRKQVLAELVTRARHSGLKVDKAVICYEEFGRTHLLGTPDLVRYLENGVVPLANKTLTF